MILVAFVLVLVATVMLIIGTFFDGGTAYIWISIGACVATFGVLAASYFARRRGADDEGARPQPLGAGESRPASVQSAPRGTAVQAGGTATATRERTEPEPESEPEVVEEADEPTVTIVPSADEETPDEATDEAVEATDEAAEEPAPDPARRRVAPRRVVRHDPTAETVAAAETPDEVADEVAEAPPAWPSKDSEDTSEAPEDTAEADDSEDAAEADEAPEDAPTAGGTRKVVRRATAAGATADGTRRVVRRVSTAGGTRKVVRRAGGGQAGGQRTVKRVVRRAPAGGEAAAAEEQPTQEKASPDRSGTRGKRARAVLSEIKGVGPAKQDALLKRFGSLENMAAASVDELADVKGVGANVAEAIKASLKDR